MTETLPVLEKQALILLVDDDEGSRYAKGRILRQAGYAVAEASSGEEALHYLAEDQPDLVLLDVRLPDISGMEVCRRIKETPETSLIPVLHMSASFSDDRSKIAGLQGGADGYITEPMEPSLLIATIGAFLRMRSAEQAVRERALELQATFDAIPDGVALVDTSRKIVRSNRALASLLKSNKGLIGADISHLLPAPADAAFWTALQKGERCRTECSDGERVFQLSLDPVSENHGQLRGSVCIVSDITDRKQMDERLWHTQKLESIGVLAGGVAHDFNNLLMGILGNASLAVEAIDNREALETSLRDISRAAERAADLTRQLLAYSGKGRFVVQPLDLSRLVSGMVPLVKASFPGKGNLVLSLASDLPAVEVDKTQVEQVIMNLLINAAEAIGDRGGTVQVTTGFRRFTGGEQQAWLSDTEIRGDYVGLEVRDNGAGMDEDTLRRIFDPFFTTKFLGRGLGLSAVLGIVRGHKGAIRVSSAPGQGTTFELVFPSSHAVVDDTNGASPPVRRPRQERRETILVVDDEPIVRDFFQSALERDGYEVVPVSDGAEVLQVFSQAPDRFSMVLLDLVMPVMTGKEVLPRLLEIRPGAKIVITSGQVEEEVRRELRDWPIAGFISKPCAIGPFLEKIEALARA